MIILTGDIGGTHSRLLLMQVIGSERQVVAEKSYPSKKYSSFTDVLKAFLSEHNIKDAIDSACFAVAGPVKLGISSITNLPWVINETELSTFLQIAKVKIINDFIAVAYAVSTLKENDVLVLQKGDNISAGEKSAAVIGAGTGLGSAHLVCLNKHYYALSSEAGHSGFAPGNQLQTELLSWMQNDHDHVSLELLLSGRGLHTIYRFLHEVKAIAESESSDVKKAIQENDPAQVISEYAQTNKDPLSQKALDCFIEIYGSAAGDIALHYFPLEEVYIAGGIATKIRHKMTEKRFINAFVNKGLMSENMKKVTIKLILNSKVGLYGALNYIINY